MRQIFKSFCGGKKFYIGWVMFDMDVFVVVSSVTEFFDDLKGLSEYNNVYDVVSWLKCHCLVHFVLIGGVVELLVDMVVKVVVQSGFEY